MATKPAPKRSPAKSKRAPRKSKLAEYDAKRDFEATPEPKAKKKPEPKPKQRRTRTKKPRFVVQEHDATRLHWDLRLERDGVAPSWAVPNGIPDDPKDNRLAVR